MSPLAIGVIGTGGMGARHALNLHQHISEARLAAVYDLDQNRAGQLAGKCNATSTRTPLELIESPEVQAIIIASPDNTHAELVHACLQAGKPVLCEKPLATAAKDALQIVRAEQETGRQLVSVGLMRRFDPQHLAVKEATDAGRIGRPLLFKGVHRNANAPQHLPGEVIVTNSAVHDLDSARWLLGQEIETVFVQGLRSRENSTPESRDMLSIQMELSGGTLASIEVSVAVGYGYEVSAELVGEHGVVTTSQPEPAIIRATGLRGTATQPDWLVRFQDAYLNELREWVRALVSGEPFAGADAWDGYVSLLAADACIRSLREGQPVRLERPQRPASAATLNSAPVKYA